MPRDDRTTTGRLQSDLLARIGARIRELRTERGWTVQRLADDADLSRRLLTQIEHGQANPSLVAVTRIARALGTDFVALLPGEPETAAIEVVGPQRRVPVWRSDRGSSAELLVATPDARAADLWWWRLMPGDGYAGAADAPGSVELFHVVSGELELSAEDERRRVPAGHSARLRSDRVYGYRNLGTEPVEFLRTVVLAG